MLRLSGQLLRPAPLINIGDDNKEVFAHYGAAMFQCQSLERRLALMLAMIESPGPDHSTREEFSDLLDGLFGKTFGRLVARFRKTGLIPDAYETRLSEALTLRNHLAHNYVWENAERFLEAGERDKMILELNQYAESMRQLEQEMAGFSKQWRERHGVTDDAVAQAEQELLRGGV